MVDNDMTGANRRRSVEPTLAGRCDLRRAGQARQMRFDRAADRQVRWPCR